MAETIDQPNPEPLRLTEDDITAAEAITRSGPIIPAAITVTLADLTAVAPQPTTTPDLHELEQQLFRLVNSARSQHLMRWLGQKNLRWHTAAAAVARGHATDMLQRSYIDHAAPEGTTVTQRLQQANITFIACGENIGVVYGDAGRSQQGILDIHNAFMNQPKALTNHRGNVLNPLWTHAGIGIARSDSGTLIATQIFICAWK